MSYRVFISLVIGSIAALLLAVSLVVGLSFRRSRQAEENQQMIELLERNQQALEEQSNKVGALLNVPPLRLRSADPGPLSVPKPAAYLQQVVLDAFTFLRQESAYKELVASTTAMLEGKRFRSFVTERAISVTRLADLASQLSQGPVLFAEIRVFSARGTLLLRNLIEQTERTLSLGDEEELVTALEQDYQRFVPMIANYRQLVARVRDFVFSPAVRNELREKRITRNERDGELVFINADGRTVAHLLFDESRLQLLFNQQEVKELDLFIRQFSRTIAQVDGNAYRERKRDKAQKFLENILSQPEVAAALAEQDLRVNTQARQEEDYFYYDLLDAEGRGQGAFALQLQEGEVYLVDSSGVQLRSLKSFLREDFDLEAFLLGDNSGYRAEHQAEAPSQEDLEVFLLVGTHDQMADSIMVVLSDHRTRRNVIVSLPRDLYYRSQKINSYYRGSGIEEFRQIISEIIGLPVSYFIVIDMYAFAEVVDLLGGLEVTLERDLVDQSYVTRSNGQWQTLSLKKGKQQLNGLQVLSLSRSRRSTSDFARSDRQQQIISALAVKLREVRLTDVSTVLALSKTFSRYVKTNLSAVAMGRIWLRVKNYALVRGGTIDDSNLLYSTYTNLVGMNDTEVAELGGDFFKGAFILLPRDNDWSLIATHFAQLLQEPARRN